MCGRYSLSADPIELAEWFDLSEPPTLPPRYNVAPSQLVAVVGRKPDGMKRGLVLMSWGFVPRWAKDPKAGPRPINAQAETVASKAPFRDSFRERRCLIPTTGFFEWETRDGTKRPHYFRPTVAPVAFAGIWDIWKGPDAAPLFTCAILTVPANRVVRPYHERMPAMLTAEDFDRWLEPTSPVSQLTELLQPFPEEWLTDTAVSPLVNSPKHDSADCLTPAM